MTDNEIISILQDLRGCEHIHARYSDLQYEFAITYAINKIRSYNDLQSHYMKLSIDYAEYREYAKHHSPIPDNY